MDDGTHFSLVYYNMYQGTVKAFFIVWYSVSRKIGSGSLSHKENESAQHDVWCIGFEQA